MECRNRYAILKNICSFDNVFYVDEAGKIYQLEEKKILAFKDNTCIRGKTSKQRITPYCCYNKSEVGKSY